MEYPPAVKKLLDAAGAREGDTVEVTGEGWSHTGVVMPHHGLSGEDVLPEVLSSKVIVLTDDLHRPVGILTMIDALEYLSSDGV